MPETFPPSLQQVLNQDNFSEQDVDTNIYTEPETGPKKVRRRFTRPETSITVEMWLDFDQYQTLKDFTRVTLKNRTLTFLYPHYVTGVPTEYRMDSPEQYTPLGNNNFRVRMVWREQP